MGFQFTKKFPYNSTSSCGLSYEFAYGSLRDELSLFQPQFWPPKNVDPHKFWPNNNVEQPILFKGGKRERKIKSDEIIYEK